MQLPKKQNFFREIPAFFLKSTSKLEHFENKDDLHSFIAHVYLKL